MSDICLPVSLFLDRKAANQDNDEDQENNEKNVGKGSVNN